MKTGTKKFVSLWNLILALPLVMISVGVTTPAQAQQPAWAGSAVIYCVNPEIFSANGLAGVTSQLTRLQSLGVNTVWLMPFSPRGQPCTVDGISHPSVNSPYCMSNMEGIASNMGTSADLTNLVSTAHGLSMKVILDVALNQTSWDNPLVTSHPQYYLHGDGNPNNVASIEDGWGVYTDIAQFNLTTDAYGAQTYVSNVCKYWLSTYNFDGFRVDTADDPSGTTRSLPQSLMQNLVASLNAINPNILVLGEEENVQLALAPYGLDYGWYMYDYGIVAAFTQANNASTLQYQWQYPYTISNTAPAGMLHMNLQDDWDKPNRDIAALGGYPQALAAAVFDFTISGVPLLYNGMEAANTNGGVNSHTQINWTGTNSSQFTTFYTQLLALRNGSGGALQQGTTTWVSNSSAAVSAYDRTGGGNEYLIEINTNAAAVSGTITPPNAASWTDVTPAGAPGGRTHTLPSTGTFSLQGYDFAIFKRGTLVTATPTFSPTPGGYTGSVSVTLSDATSGATLYYTTNGATPTTGSTKYTGAISISAMETIKAIATASGDSNSSIASGTYTLGAATGSLSGTLTTVSSPQTFNLTTLGTTDWGAWGYNGFDHAASGSGKVSSVSVYGGGSLNAFTSSFLGFTWTNGTPDAGVTGETKGYYNAGGVGDGFTFTVPASTSAQTLTVYVGGWTTGGTLTATLSDGSAPAYTNSSLSNLGSSYYGYYTLVYKAASASQKLTIVWKEASGTGNVTLYAAALH